MTGQLEYLRKWVKDVGDGSDIVNCTLVFSNYHQMEHWWRQAIDLYRDKVGVRVLYASKIIKIGKSTLYFRTVAHYPDAERFFAGVHLNDAWIGPGVDYPSQQLIRSRVRP